MENSTVFLLPFVCSSINNIFDIYIFLKAIYCKHVTIMYPGKYNLSLLNKLLVYLQKQVSHLIHFHFYK